MSSDLTQANAAKRLRELIRTLEAPEPQKEARLDANAVSIRRTGSRAEKAPARAMHSLREARNDLSTIITTALAGEPQIIKRRGGRAVVIMSIETAKDLVALAEPPRSLADMFPVDESHPPVSPLVLTHRPGQRGVKF